MTALAATACGGNGSAVPDAAIPVDASPDAALPVIKVGSLLFGEQVQSGTNTTLSGGAFGSVAQADSNITDGPCTIDVSTRGSMMTLVSAGTITINYGSNQSLMLLPDGQNMYSDIAQQFRYAAGDVLAVSATGATVPAFTNSITFPAAVTVTSPTLLAVVHQSGVTTTWTPTTSPVQIEINQYLDGSHAIFVGCSYAGGAGTGTISASTLAHLVAGTSASFAIYTEAREMIAAGDYNVTLEAAFIGFSTNVTVQP
jgi:hypothetical protein